MMRKAVIGFWACLRVDAVVLVTLASTAVANLEVVVKEGDQAPGTPLGTVFNGFGTPSLNASGEMAFVGTLTGPGVTSANNAGIWGADGAGGLRLIARDGEQAPGTPLGTVFDSFNDPVLNAAGEVAFNAFLTGPGVTSTNVRGIWLSDGLGSVRLIARDGDQAPG